MAGSIYDILKRTWGYDSFRPLQEDIIKSILDGKDTLALLPTGGGKSLCFQVPALAIDGICVVVSPLIALMRDQVENLTKRGVKADYVHSGMSKREIDILLDNCVYGNYKFLYISPERLKTDVFIERFKKMNVAFVAIDEAHCISEWGYDFRPAYLEIEKIREQRPGVNFLALTASATHKVQDDIVEKLQFNEGFQSFRKSFDRPNLIYAITMVDDKHTRVLYALSRSKGSAIIYARNRRQTKELSEWLNSRGFQTTFFHAGLSAQVKNNRQEAWLNNKVRVMVATNAFGMGIDKPDVRLVLHMGMPDSLEAYYQEAGRAGRDGEKSFAVALAASSDLQKLQASMEVNHPKIEDLVTCYHALGSFLQVPIGAGFGNVFDFDLAAFCKVYNFSPLHTLKKLHVLQQSGYIQFNEATFESSRIHFTVKYEDMYAVMVSNKNLDRITKAILRIYGGMFDHYVKISEGKIAQMLSQPVDFVKQQLDELHRMKIIDYVKQTGQPKITYLLHRHDKRSVRFDRAFLSQRKEVAQEKIDAVVRYVETDDKCRGNIILDYFNEKPESDCGHCDYCLSKGHSMDEIYHKIKAALPADGLDVKSLQKGLNIPVKQFQDTLAWMLGERIVELDGEMVYHCN